MKKRKLALHTKIILGMILGLLLGGLLSRLEGGKLFISHWVSPFGNMFIKTLELITIPLIMASLIKGIADLKDISKFSKMGLRTVILYLMTTVIAIVLGLVMVNIIQPGSSISQETKDKLFEEYNDQSVQKINTANEQRQMGPLQPLEDVIPNNIFSSASNNRNILQIIFFSIFLGISIILIPPKKSKPLKNFFSSLNDVTLKMIDIIMSAAPVGVFALMASLVAKAPGKEFFLALGIYAITVLAGLMLMVCLYVLTVWFYVKIPPNVFLKAISPAQLLAFSTSSSVATLPVTKEQVEQELKVSERTSSFVLPLGATINMDGTSLYQAVAAVFIAQALGIPLDINAQIGIVMTSVLASIGTAGVPGASLIMLIFVLAQAGIPEAGIALILAIDRPLDMCRTVINITGDATICTIMDKATSKGKI